MSANPEQRALPRIPVDSAVVYTEPGSDTIHHGRARNLSGGGLLFITSHRPDTGSLLDVHMRASPGRVPSLRAVVRVVRVTPDQRPGQFQVAATINEASR